MHFGQLACLCVSLEYSDPQISISQVRFHIFHNNVLCLHILRDIMAAARQGYQCNSRTLQLAQIHYCFWEHCAWLCGIYYGIVDTSISPRIGQKRWYHGICRLLAQMFQRNWLVKIVVTSSSCGFRRTDVVSSFNFAVGRWVVQYLQPVLGNYWGDISRCRTMIDGKCRRLGLYRCEPILHNSNLYATAMITPMSISLPPFPKTSGTSINASIMSTAHYN